MPPRPEPAPPEPAPPLMAPPLLDPAAEQPRSLYGSESPNLPPAVPRLRRPTEAEFLIKQSDDRFALGKRALQEGRISDARREFDRAVETLLSAPESLPDRAQVELHLEQIVEDIYKYDLDQTSSHEGSGDPQVSYEKRPLDDILELTFPVDPGLRSKVRRQIQNTPSQLPLEENDAVLSFINFFTSDRGKKILTAGLRRSGRYRDMILRVLAEEGLPPELIFLAQAESGFYPRAISYAACVGIWQFAKFRGNEYGLTQTVSTDERMDPEKSTRAAALHLKDLFNHFGDWYLAMAAYNCGPGCIDSAVMRTGYADFWTLRRLGAIPQQTANYVPAILAMTIVARNAADYGLAVDFDPSLEFETIELEAPTSLALAAVAVDRPVSELAELNPAVLKGWAPAGYHLHIPVGSSDRLHTALAAVPPQNRNLWKVHRVESGDTAAAISKRYGIGTSAFLAANAGELPEPGAFVAIPVSAPAPVKVARNTKTPTVHAKPPAGKATAASVPKNVAPKSAGSTSAPAPKAANKPAPAVVRKSAVKRPVRRPPA